MRLLAISDLHIGHHLNSKALRKIAGDRSDWLMLGGDVAESTEDLRTTLEFLSSKFARLIWVPGNHELWTLPKSDETLRGVEKYNKIVSLCRELGVLTPEDPYPQWRAGDKLYRIIPMFLLYDYSFRPLEIRLEDSLSWATEQGLVCIDEHLLHPDPFLTKAEWCAARCEATFSRLSEIPKNERLILLNHFPLCYDLALLPLIPRFSVWCGTRKTENWHKDFNVESVVYGHLHWPKTQWRDGVKFDEVSLGYPRQWKKELTINEYVRVILPSGNGIL